MHKVQEACHGDSKWSYAIWSRRVTHFIKLHMIINLFTKTLKECL